MSKPNSLALSLTIALMALAAGCSSGPTPEQAAREQANRAQESRQRAEEAQRELKREMQGQPINKSGVTSI